MDFETKLSKRKRTDIEIDPLNLDDTVLNSIDFKELERTETELVSKKCEKNVYFNVNKLLRTETGLSTSSGVGSAENYSIENNSTTQDSNGSVNKNERLVYSNKTEEISEKRKKLSHSNNNNTNVNKSSKIDNRNENKEKISETNLEPVDSNQDVFSQNFNTQMLQQIDKSINRYQVVNSNENKADINNRLFKLPLLTAFTEKVHQLQQKKDKLVNDRTELFKDKEITMQYRKEVDSLFEQIEHSICVMGTEHAIFDKTFPDEILDVIFSEDNNTIEKINDKKEQQNISDINWSNESLLNEETSSLNLSGIIKQALKNNASKSVQKIVDSSPNLSFSESVAAKPAFHNLGPFYGLPLKVKELIKLYRGIDELYDWQDECLKLPAIENRKNLIYALPTSGGKTMVAEILMLREIMCYQRNAIFILPYVAIVQEKVWALSPFGVGLDFLVEEYASSKGTYPPRKRRRKHSVYIATIEKALGLINSLIENNRLHEVGLIVVDELHLIGEEGRGSTLESCLTKIMYLNANIQIVGMSATIGNIQEICKFLDADVYSKNFRPVELLEYVKCGNEIAKINWNAKDQSDLLIDIKKVDFKYSESVSKLDPDYLAGFVMEVIPKDSCLVFCASKKNCENVAVLLCKTAKPDLKQYRKTEKEQLLHALKDEAGDLCDTLKVSVQYGIAYHHSGLTNDERRIIEDGFREGIICVICCTSTLAAGVNLPARRVILRSPYVGREFISLSRYKQMSGRAGRAGMGETGESIIITQRVDLPRLKDLLMSPMNRAFSSMHMNEAVGLRQLLLSCISLGIATTRTELQAVSQKTLMAVQCENLEVNVKQLTDKSIKTLFKLGALQENCVNNSAHTNDVTVRMETSLIDTQNSSIVSESNSTPKKSVKKKTIVLTNNSKLRVSNLGCAAIKGGLELRKAHQLYEDLYQAQRSLVLLDCIHLLYLVTPYETSEQVKPNNQVYYDILSNLSEKEMHTAKILGLNESVAVKLLSNLPIKNVPEKVLNRFYVTMMLYDLWQEMPVFKVSEKYQVNRGIVQNLMTIAATFASNVVNFCEQLEEFWAFAHLLRGMSQRLSHCCIKELLPLMDLPAVKQSRAKQLYNAGYKTIQSIAKASANDLVDKIEFMSKKVANQLIAASKMLLLEKVENLREEAEDVLDGVDNPKQFFNQSIRTF